MKTLLIATALVATSFAASAMEYGVKYGPNTKPQATAHSGITRAQVIAEYEAAKAAGQVNITEFEMRRAERSDSQSKLPKVSWQHAQQESVSWNDTAQSDIHNLH